MNQPKISVVISVYNCEKFFEVCLKSLKHQTFRDFEVIIVNNHSTDRSAKIAEQFVNEDNRFHLINNFSGGAGPARTFGIQHAKGEYIAFVDADDRVTPNYLEALYNAAVQNDADIAVCGFSLYFLNQQKTEPATSIGGNKVYTPEQAMSVLLMDKKFRFYLWNKLWRKSLFTEHHIEIPDMYYEDAVTCPMLFYYANKVVTVDEGLYIYTRVLSKYKEINMSARRANDYIKSVGLIRRFLEEQGCFQQYKRAFNHHFAKVYFSVPLLSMQIAKSAESHVLTNTAKGCRRTWQYRFAKKEKFEKINLNDYPIK